MSLGGKDPLLCHGKSSSRLPSKQELRCGEQELDIWPWERGCRGGYLRLPTGVSGGSRLARGAAQLNQEKLGKKGWGIHIPVPLRCGSRKHGDQRAKVGRAAEGSWSCSECPPQEGSGVWTQVGPKEDRAGQV